MKIKYEAVKRDKKKGTEEYKCRHTKYSEIYTKFM